MRILIQLLLPTLVVIFIAVMILRRRTPQPQGPEQPLSTPAFIAIITIGAALTAVLVISTQGGFQ